MKRKLLALLMATAMVFSVAACGSEKDESKKEDSVKKEDSDQKDESDEKGEDSETAEFKTYEPNFTASGTDADVWNENMDIFTEYFGEYYADDLDKIAGYDEGISATVAGVYASTDPDKYAKLEARYGETINQTRWLDLYKRLYNADVEYKWTALDSEYDQKLRLDMTAGDLPDIFLVRQQSDVIELADAGLIWDMTEVMDEYATDEMKEIWQSDNGIGLSKVTIEESVYGLPAMQSNTDNFSYLWIRSDWLDALGLEYPETIEDLESIIEAFVKADFDGNGVDDTVGMLFDKDLYYAARGLFNAYGAYPEIWVEEDGVLSWGGASEENKDALATLADWYQKGYISKEFITEDNATAQEDIFSGKCGIVYGGHWFGHKAGDLHEMDADSDWVAVPLPTGNGEEVRSPLISYVAGWVVVNKEFEHPELAVKMVAVMRAALSSPVGSWVVFEDGGAWGLSPVKSLVSAWDNLFTYQNLQVAYENNDDTSVLVGKAPTYWANLHGDLQWEWELMFGPGEHTPMTVLEESYENDKLFYDAFYGIQSEFMLERFSTIKDEQLIAFTKMITGEVDVETGFSQWLDTFNSLGGEQITEEVNEWYNNK